MPCTAAFRMGRAHIGDDLDAALQGRGHDCLHPLQQHGRVAFGRVLGSVQRFPGDGALGQAFHRQIVKLAAFDDFHTGRDAVIGKAGDAILAPAIGAAAGMVMRERGPSDAIRAVILAHGAPLPLGQIRPPAPPRAGFRHVGNASAFGFSH